MTPASGGALPNTRVQRTRSSASPPHSPLTRNPLGGSFRSPRIWASAISLCSMVGCVTINGKDYFQLTAPPFVATSTCEPAEVGVYWTVRVRVSDEGGGSLPGATVRFVSVPGNDMREEVTNANGVTQVRLSSGLWRIRASLPAFTTAQYDLSLAQSQVCTVTVFLRIDPKATPTVT